MGVAGGFGCEDTAGIILAGRRYAFVALVGALERGSVADALIDIRYEFASQGLAFGIGICASNCLGTS